MVRGENRLASVPMPRVSHRRGRIVHRVLGDSMVAAVWAASRRADRRDGDVNGIQMASAAGRTSRTSRRAVDRAHPGKKACFPARSTMLKAHRVGGTAGSVGASRRSRRARSSRRPRRRPAAWAGRSSFRPARSGAGRRCGRATGRCVAVRRPRPERRTRSRPRGIPS